MNLHQVEQTGRRAVHSRRAGLLVCLLVCSLVCILLSACTLGAPAVGDPAPDFTLPILYKHSVSLSGYKGSPVVLFFFATWCSYCVQEIPGLLSMQARYQNQDLNTLAINMTCDDKMEAVEALVKNQKWFFYPFLDPDCSTAKKYRVSSIPVTFFIDREQIIRSIHRGYASPEEIEAGIKKIIPKITPAR
ncbi:MAG TPA: TlpA disulfide reductase family protein [Anaerolineaceae bacterium]